MVLGNIQCKRPIQNEADIVQVHPVEVVYSAGTHKVQVHFTSGRIMCKGAYKVQVHSHGGKYNTEGVYSTGCSH